MIRNLYFLFMGLLFTSFHEDRMRNRLKRIVLEIILKIESVGDVPKNDRELKDYFERMVGVLQECCKKIRKNRILEELPKKIFPYNERFIGFILFYENKSPKDLLEKSELLDEVNRVPIFLHEKIWDELSLVRCIEKELGLIKTQNTKELLDEIEKEFALQ